MPAGGALVELPETGQLIVGPQGIYLVTNSGRTTTTIVGTHRMSDGRVVLSATSAS